MEYAKKYRGELSQIFPILVSFYYFITVTCLSFRPGSHGPGAFWVTLQFRRQTLKLNRIFCFSFVL